MVAKGSSPAFTPFLIAAATVAYQGARRLPGVAGDFFREDGWCFEGLEAVEIHRVWAVQIEALRNLDETAIFNWGNFSRFL